MKKARVLFLLAAVVTMTLAFSIVTYASSYDDLSVTSKTFYSNNASDLGVYPVVKDMADVNKKILDFVQKAYWNMPGYNSADFTSNKFKSSYTVEDSAKTTEGANQYAKVTVSVRALVISGAPAKDDAFVLTLYIDKEAAKDIAEADYTAGLEAEKTAAAEEEPAAEEEADVEEIMALRSNVELAGYKYEYNSSTKKITITKAGAKDIVLTLDINVYPIAGVKLDSAPTLKDGSIMVPNAFFTEILGVEVSLVNGKYVVAE